MKIIVLCGVHASETAAIEICNRLGKKKSFWTRLLRSHSHRLRLGKKKGEEYTDLSKLANRTITDKEVKFLDLSRYGSHAFAKWVHRVSLKKILEIYEKHIRETKRAPKKCKEFLCEYVSLWKRYIQLWDDANKDWEVAAIDQLPNAAQFAEELEILVYESRLYFCQLYENRLFNYRNIIRNYFIPKELKNIFKNFNILIALYKNDRPRIYRSNPLIKKELEKSPNAFIIDLHCTSNEEIKGIQLPFANGGIFLPVLPNLNREEIEKEFRKIVINASEAFIPKEFHVYYSPEKVGSMLIEIVAPYEKYASNKHNFAIAPPTLIFFYNLMNVFNPSKYNRYNINSHLDIIGDGRERIVDPEFYKTIQFENSKKVIARLIRALLEWGERCEARAGR